MQKTHIPSLCVIERQCFSKPWSAYSLESRLVDPAAHFFVALLNRQVAGYVGMTCFFDEAFIHNIAVSPHFRRSGVASALLRRVDVCVAQNTLSRVTLEVRNSNLAAIALYEKFGFKFLGMRRDFYEKPAEDARIYTKEYI